jgi:hypothetical protein
MAGVDATPANPIRTSDNSVFADSDEREGIAAVGGFDGVDIDPALEASTSTFKFAGKIDSGNYAPKGTKFTGSYVFNPAARDSNKRASEGTYKMSAPYGMVVNIAGRPALKTYKGLTIWVGNNVDNKDWYEVEPTNQTSVEMYLSLRTSNKSAFLNDKLPLTPPKISSTMFWGVLDLYVNGKSAVGTITSITR